MGPADGISICDPNDRGRRLGGFMYSTVLTASTPRSRKAWLPFARAAGLALTALTVFASAALAAPSTYTITASGGFDAATGKPDSCSTTEWLFVINGVSPAGTAPTSISVVFDTNGTPTAVDVALTFQQTFLNPPETTAHYSIPIDSTSAAYVFDGASAQLPVSTTYNNFVLSHGSCAGSTSITPPPPPPGPGATPELDSLALFGTGIIGLGGYVLTRLRASRRRPE